ncbi:MAG: DUF4384 domain-containing protein [Aureispira sp.]|nr:DUF4384 domain-containing protein [Aureispira sp.]
MAIRFGEDNRNTNSGGGGGGRNSGNNNDNRAGAAILLAILLFVFKKPKIAIPLLLVGAVAFFIFAPEELQQQILGDDTTTDSESIYSMGCSIDPEKYDDTEAFEALAASSSHYNIPSRASLLKYAPSRRNQGQQGSCVGWASAYAARTILEAHTTGRNPDDIAFSPSFLYNQIALRGCNGSYTSEALEKMKRDGLLAFSKFPYNQNSCNAQPSSSQLSEARNFRIRGYNRLTMTGGNYDVDIEAIKQNIAQGAPVVIAVKVPPSFNYVNGDRWKPDSHEANNVRNYGGHAMCLIGYDENKNGGSFQIMNSWGRDWGNDGVTWVNYRDFQTFCREAYGLYPHPKAKTSSDSKFSIDFGLITWDEGNTNQPIPVKRTRGNVFDVIKPLRKGEKFKIESVNNTECYMYAFTLEADGRTSTRIFPHDAKTSPYCGIVGPRHIPKAENQFFFADDSDVQERFTLVFSKKPLDYDAVSRRITNSRKSNYEDRVMDALSDRLISNVKFKTRGNSQIGFEAAAKGSRDAVAVVMTIDKY